MRVSPVPPRESLALLDLPPTMHHLLAVRLSYQFLINHHAIKVHSSRCHHMRKIYYFHFSLAAGRRTSRSLRNIQIQAVLTAEAGLDVSQVRPNKYVSRMTLVNLIQFPTQVHLIYNFSNLADGTTW